MRAVLRTFIIFIVCVPLTYLATQTAIEFIAGWHQWSIDRAYNKGRDMERICANHELPEVCEKHNADTGHNEFSSPVPGR